jgi:hypothetical protein
MDRSKQVCRLGEILESQFEEEFLTRLPFLEFLANRGIIGSTVLDSVLEDCRVRGQARNGQLVNVAFERAARQQVACYVIQPDALA